MAIPDYLIPELKRLVHDLVNGDFELLEKDGRAGRLTASEIRKALADYGHVLMDIPDSEYEKIEPIRVQSLRELWAIDLDLWAAGQGRSELTLSVEATILDKSVTVMIIDLHVL
ncbi:MAG TPA: hypothetical protein VJ302_13640 [Blastocatellia bacterium]|nr:hypothetical protein [Blastocatellia bacterium]